MSDKLALVGASIFEGEKRRENHAVLIDDGKIASLCAAEEIPPEFAVEHLNGGLLAPGYIDLQVNGGGGVLFNDQPSVESIQAICAAHRRFGTTALLVTLITDTPEIMERAIAAGVEASRQSVPGFLGLHLEGPHLAKEKAGAHAPSLIRSMTSADLNQLLDAKRQLFNLMVTVAPESVTDDQVRKLSTAGIIVSIGHSNASFATAQNTAEAGATCVTHLFNAMSPFEHREPGIVGAALQNRGLCAGLIADGFHVDPTAIAVALNAKKGPGKIFLVSDAMSTIGTDMTEFNLNGRKILRQGGRLTLEDGTLAGADLDINSAVQFMHNKVGTDLDEAIRMASLYPAQCMGLSQQLGAIKKELSANIIHLDEHQQVARTWILGKAS